MSVATITAWVCDFPKCGHVWYAAKEPIRCAKCKKPKWNKIKGEVIPPPKKHKGRKKTVKSPDGFAEITTPAAIVIAEPIVPVEVLQPEPIVTTLVLSDTQPIIEETPVIATSKPLLVTAAELPQISNSTKSPEPHRSAADKYREILKKLASPEHKIGEKCPHGWANWLSCPKCNPKAVK